MWKRWYESDEQCVTVPITNVTILEHTETVGLADPALERVPQQITAGQTLNVDAVSGATNPLR